MINIRFIIHNSFFNSKRTNSHISKMEGETNLRNTLLGIQENIFKRKRTTHNFQQENVFSCKTVYFSPTT